jgi:hypothetical protein
MLLAVAALAVSAPAPVQYEKLGRDWGKFAASPSGIGPFKLTKLVQRELAELSKNADTRYFVNSANAPFQFSGGGFC